jgi:hypothetical protein
MEELTPLEQDFLDAGIKRGAAAILERQLTRRFGPLPKTVQKKLAAAELEQLNSWGDALLDARSLRQIFNPRPAGPLRPTESRRC